MAQRCASRRPARIRSQPESSRTAEPALREALSAGKAESGGNSADLFDLDRGVLPGGRRRPGVEARLVLGDEGAGDVLELVDVRDVGGRHVVEVDVGRGPEELRTAGL